MPHRSKWVLGTNLYGMDWPNGGGPSNVATALEYGSVQALIARVGARPVYDPTADSWHFSYNEGGVPHEVWFSTAGTIGRRIQLAADRGLGIGFWRLGEESEAVWADGRLITSSIWPQVAALDRLSSKTDVAYIEPDYGGRSHGPSVVPQPDERPSPTWRTSSPVTG